MKSYVITIVDNPLSVQAAKRCIKSGRKFGLDIQMWRATTPKDNPEKIMKEKGIDPDSFKEIWSRWENCMAAFLSHHSLWEKCLQSGEDTLIFEHDAVIRSDIPEMQFFGGVMSFGKPSYGKFNIPKKMGRNKLQSKQYFPGAHAYLMSPHAAKIVIEKAKTEAAPTDIFFHNKRFDFLEEYYPFCVEAVDNFTTIQNERGCLAKTRYSPETYKII